MYDIKHEYQIYFLGAKESVLANCNKAQQNVKTTPWEQTMVFFL